MNRRTFVKKGSLSLGAIPLIQPFTLNTGNSNKNGAKPEIPGATPAQKAWMDLGFGMFIHFGINTFLDKEWSGGEADLSVFDPGEVNTDQWCQVAKKAGMKYIVIVTKHHDGFCLWPSRQTRFTVANTPYQQDILKKLTASARAEGLKLGFYYSLWDRHEPTYQHDEWAYIEFMKRQFGELLTWYGDVVEFWLDGFWKKQQTGWKDENNEWAKPGDFVKSWRYEGAFRWHIDHIYQYIKQLQPDCIVMNNATTKFPATPLHPVDALSGEKATHLESYRKVWPWLGKERFFPLQIETTMSREGKEQFQSGSWFWHDWDHSVAAREQVLSWRQQAKTLGANLLLNCGPMSNGKLRPEDVEVLSSL